MPVKRFVLATWTTATVGPDIHAKVGKTLYSIPRRFMGQRIDARSTATTMLFFHNGQLIATHGHKPSGKQTDLSHYPVGEDRVQDAHPTWCRKRAGEIGPFCVRLVDGLLEVHALFRPRAAQGVLRLADKHTPARLEAACAKAIAVADPSFRTVIGILAAGTETEPPARSRGDGGAAFLHGPSQLFANVIPMPNTGGQLGTDLAHLSGNPDGPGHLAIRGGSSARH